MTRLGAAFKNSQDLRIKTFEIAGQTFRVRIPLTKEMEAIEERVKEVDQAKFDERYEKLVAGFDKNIETAGVVFTDDDVIVDGRSTKDVVRIGLQFESRVVEFIRLLVPQEGTLDDLTYEEIESEWPLSVQIEIVGKIGDAIQPGYKDERKN